MRRVRHAGTTRGSGCSQVGLRRLSRWCAVRSHAMKCRPAQVPLPRCRSLHRSLATDGTAVAFSLGGRKRLPCSVFMGALAPLADPLPSLLVVTPANGWRSIHPRRRRAPLIVAPCSGRSLATLAPARSGASRAPTAPADARARRRSGRSCRRADPRPSCALRRRPACQNAQDERSDRVGYAVRVGLRAGGAGRLGPGRAAGGARGVPVHPRGLSDDVHDPALDDAAVRRASARRPSPTRATSS